MSDRSNQVLLEALDWISFFEKKSADMISFWETKTPTESRFWCAVFVFKARQALKRYHEIESERKSSELQRQWSKKADENVPSQRCDSLHPQNETSNHASRASQQATES